MNNERGRAAPSVYQPAQSAFQQGDTARLKPANLPTFLGKASAALAVFLLCSGLAAAQGNSPVQLRQFIGQQEGGINNLTVPATNAAIPVPPPVAGSGNTPYRYQTTEAKRYLGKLLFHDPVRTTRIGPATNTGQPKNLPAGAQPCAPFCAPTHTIAGI